MFSADGLDRAPMLLSELNELTRLSIDLPHDFPLGHFHLCSDRDLVAARHAGRTSAGELSGAETSQHCEFERADVSWTLYHANHPFMTRLSESETVEMCPNGLVALRTRHRLESTPGCQALR
jgi:hypothetical protein